MRLFNFLVLAALAGVPAACSSANLKSASDYSAPSAPPVKHPYYSPYAAYGEANATWTPPVWNRNGTITRPADPGVDMGRPNYESAPWATGATGGRAYAPPGTF